MCGKMVSGERVQMQPGEAMRSTAKKYDGVDGKLMGSNEMVGAKGVFTGPARVSRNQQVGVNGQGHKHDAARTEDLTPMPLYTH